MRHIWLVAGVVVMGLASGCADQAVPAKPASASPASASPEKAAKEYNFAGRVSGTGSSIAVAVSGDRALAYVCDGVNEAWLNGEASGDGLLSLRAKSGQSGQLVGTVDDRLAWGSVRIKNRFSSFHAAAVDRPAGLYRAASPRRKLVAGWVVLPDGSQVGVVNDNGVETQAPDIDPAQGTVTIDGEQLQLKSGLQQLASGG
jgi:hypothetical protein